MKHLFFYTIILGFSTLKAQDIPPQKLESTTSCTHRPQMWVKAGANFSGVYDPVGMANARPNNGVTAGVSLLVPLSQYVGIQTEALFSQKGFRAGGLTTNNFTVVRTSNYIDVPLMIALRPYRLTTFVAGPVYSLWMSHSDNYTDVSENNAESFTLNNDAPRASNLGILTGVDFNIKKISIGARFGFDLFSNTRDEASPTQYKNIWIQTTVGFKIF